MKRRPAPPGAGGTTKKATEMKTVILEDNEVMTLEEVAVKLHGMYKWATYETYAKEGAIRFTERDGRHFCLRTSGFVYEIVNGKESEKEDAEREINFGEDFDLVNYIWAKDTEGNTVLINE